MGLTPGSADDTGHRLGAVLEIFSSYRFNRVLDLGCGDGNFSALLRDACCASEIYGIDASEKGVELARARGVDALCLDIDHADLPFEEGFFDAVFVGETIEHLFDPDHMLDEVHRVLVPQGILVLTTPNLASIHNRLALLLGFQPFPTNVSLRHSIGHMVEAEGDPVPCSDHLRVFTLGSLKAMIRLHGFDILSIRGSTAARGPIHREGLLWRIVARAAWAMDRIISMYPPLSFRVIVTARKVSDSAGAAT